MKRIVGTFEIPLTGRELLIALRDGKPVRIGRPFLVKALQLVEECSEAVIDVQTEGSFAFMKPDRFRLNKIGEQRINSLRQA